MKEQKSAIAAYLLDDDTLMDKLAENRPWWDETGVLDTANSVIPESEAPLENGPYLTVEAFTETQAGTNLVDSFYIIRCYNADSKTFVTIDEVLERVKALLHGHRFNYSDQTVSIDMVYESTGPELTDDQKHQKFRESQYKVRYI